MRNEPNSNIRDAVTGEQVSAITHPHPSSRRKCVLLNAAQRTMLEPTAARQLAAELMNAADASEADWPAWSQPSPKPLRNFIQIDGFAGIEPGDYIMVPDDDGDVLFRGETREPQLSGTTVRIHIAAEADDADALRILRKQIAWIEKTGLKRRDDGLRL